MKRIIVLVLSVILFENVIASQSPVDSIEKQIKMAIFTIYKPIILNETNGSNLDKFEKRAVRKYGEMGEEVFWGLKAFYYYLAFDKSKQQDDFESWVKIKIAFNKKYPNGISEFDLNNDAWLVFENSSKKKQLKGALAWSKKAIANVPTANYYDTYANLLYKLGRKEEAIAAMEKGLKLPLGDVADDNAIKVNFEKMKRGEKTWSE